MSYVYNPFTGKLDSVLGNGSPFSGGLANSVLYVDSSGLLATDANLTWDGNELLANTIRSYNNVEGTGDIFVKKNTDYYTILAGVGNWESGRLGLYTYVNLAPDYPQANLATFDVNDSLLRYGAGISQTLAGVNNFPLLTANAVPYLNGSKDLVTSSNFTYDGTNFNFDGGAVFNEAGANLDFRVESDTNQYMFHIDANGKAGTGSIGIGGAAYAPNGPLIWIYGEVWQFVAGNVRTLVGESSSFFGGFGWIDATNIFQVGNGTLDQLQFDSSNNVIINEAGRSCDFRVEGDTDINCLIVDGSADRVGIGIAAPLTKLHVESTALGQFRVGYNNANYLNVSIGSTGIATITSSGSVSGMQFQDALGLFLQSNLGGVETLLSAPAYGDYLSLSYDVSLYNGTSSASITIGGGGNIDLLSYSSITLTDSMASNIQLDGSGGISINSNGGSYMQFTGGAVNIYDSSAAYIGLSYNIIITPATGGEYIFNALPTSTATTGALYYDSMTNIVYYNP